MRLIRRIADGVYAWLNWNSVFQALQQCLCILMQRLYNAGGCIEIGHIWSHMGTEKYRFLPLPCSMTTLSYLMMQYSFCTSKLQALTLCPFDLYCREKWCLDGVLFSWGGCRIGTPSFESFPWGTCANPHQIGQCPNALSWTFRLSLLENSQCSSAANLVNSLCAENMQRKLFSFSYSWPKIICLSRNCWNLYQNLWPQPALQHHSSHMDIHL